MKSHTVLLISYGKIPDAAQAAPFLLSVNGGWEGKRKLLHVQQTGQLGRKTSVLS